MTVSVAGSWLPPELTTVQPYSMGPTTRWSAPFPRGATLPAMGTCVGMDRPELMIATCFVAPAAVQADARKRGERAMIMMMPPGLAERLDTDPKLWPRRPKAAADPVEVAHELSLPHGPVPKSFVDALMALEEDD